MITKIAIENFKGIGERVEIPIRPLTLLFGPNSAGKSSIMHAFHYAREIFERHNLDADRTIAGGDFVDLGGFQNFVHDHKPDNVIRFRLDMDLREADAPEYYFPVATWRMFPAWSSGWVSVEIAWDDLRQRPFVKSYEAGVNEDLFGRITCERGEVVISKCEFDHPALMDETEEDEDLGVTPLEDLVHELDVEEFLAGDDFIHLLNQEDALPPCGRPLTIDHNWEAEPSFDPEGQRQPAGAIAELVGGLSQVFVGMADIARDELRRFYYLGPFRQKPPRDYTPPRFPDTSRWATGLGAWDVLHAAEEKLLDHVNLWMAHEVGLDTGYTLQRKGYVLLDEEGPLYSNLVTYRAFDEIEDLALELDQQPKRGQLVLANEAGLLLALQDVGEGIAQVLPVVVAALCPDASAVQIEQPELHLHPKQQAALGDLLIRGALGKPAKPIIAETHSEHLVLRVLRRIRETTRGDEPFMGIPVTAENVAVYYVQMKVGQSSLLSIDVDDKGEFVQPWPDDFFEIDFQERFA